MHLSNFKLGKHRGPYIERTYSTDGRNILLSEYHYNSRGWPHRDPEDGPAILDNNLDGTPFFREYRWHGLLHRDNGPASICYFKDGTMCREGWFRFGRCHRRGRPAWIIHDQPGILSQETWYLHNYEFRYPRIGPQTSVYDWETGRLYFETYAEEVPTHPEPPLRWLRKTFGENICKFEA